MTRRRWVFAAFCLLLAAGFAALGVWQVERRAWKLDLIARVDARTRAAPAPLPLPAAWQGDTDYRRVRATGTLLNDRETLVQALTERGARIRNGLADHWTQLEEALMGELKPRQRKKLGDRLKRFVELLSL